MMNVWRLMAHYGTPKQRRAVIKWAEKNRRIAIGWSDLCDLRQYQTAGDIAEAAWKIYRGILHVSNISRCGDQLWNFCRTMQCGDLVILKGVSWQNSVVMQVDGSYDYVPGSQTVGDVGYHQREVQVKKIDPQDLWKAAVDIKRGRPCMLPGEFIRNALIQCQFQVECQGGQMRRVNDA